MCCSQAWRTRGRGTSGDTTSDPRAGTGHDEKQTSANLMGRTNPTCTKLHWTRVQLLAWPKTGIFNQSHCHPNSHSGCEGPQHGPVTHNKHSKACTAGSRSFKDEGRGVGLIYQTKGCLGPLTPGQERSAFQGSYRKDVGVAGGTKGNCPHREPKRHSPCFYLIEGALKDRG